MFALSILGLLMGEPLHGYEIRKQLSELLGLSGAISYGSLYPTLARLHSQGLVTSSTGEPFQPKPTNRFAQQNVFSTGSLSGDIAFGTQSPFVRKSAISNPRKSKKVYTITEKGIESFKSKLLNSYVEHADDDKAFVAHLAFFELCRRKRDQNFLGKQNRSFNKKAQCNPKYRSPNFKTVARC
jgi:DNA-binding PadR family transcriptional regulator